MDQVPYFNDLLVRFEEIFYHELSGCARPKVELIGTDFLQSKGISGATVDEVVGKCAREIKAGGLVDDITHSIHGFGILLKLTVKGCIHLPMESKLKEGGLEPFLCPVANMILDQIISVLGYETTYTANLEIDERNARCTAKCAIYETVDKIGQVSDWTEV